MNEFGKSKGGGRRNAARAPAPLLSFLSTANSDHRVGVINLSPTGLRASGPDLPAQGEDVIFKSGSAEIFGRVVWSAGCQCGVAFHALIPENQIEKLMLMADQSSGGSSTAENSG